MEAKSPGYSTKNIPLSNKGVYLKEVIGKTEHFSARLHVKFTIFWKITKKKLKQKTSDFEH